MNLAGFEIGMWVRSADGFAVSGDGAAAHTRAGVLVLGIIDALGHGPDAHSAALIAEELLARTDSVTVPDLLTALNDELADTVGAAIGLATLDAQTGQGAYIGIGNTVARILGRTERRLLSIDGIVGKRPAAARPAAFTLLRGETLLMHTDGISSRIAPANYADLLAGEANSAAREMVRRFGRNHDDSACIVARWST